MSKQQKYVGLGAICVKKERDSEGRKQYYFKLSDDVEITVNGRKYNNKYIQVSRPTDKYDRMLEKGTLSTEEYDKKCEQFEEGGKLEYITFELSAEFKES